MATILDAILSEKKIEVDQLKMNQTRLNNINTENSHTPRSFISVLEKTDKLAIISEFKISIT